MPSSTAAKKTAGPGYYDLIKEAVLSLNERNGSSRQAIDKFVAAKKGAAYTKPRLNIALKRGVESGKLIAVKGSFKLAAEEKKGRKTNVAAPTKTAVKKPVVKKTVAKKKKKKVVKKPTVIKKKKVEKPRQLPPIRWRNGKMLR